MKCRRTTASWLLEIPLVLACWWYAAMLAIEWSFFAVHLEVHVIGLMALGIQGTRISHIVLVETIRWWSSQMEEGK